MAEKILVIDDDLETLRLVKLMLERLEYAVFTAPDGHSGLHIVTTEHPDLVLLDVMMPEMDGYEVARRIRGNPLTAHTPILMFTAKSQIEDKVTAFEEGIDGFLTKPTHPKELAVQVRALLRRSKTTNQAFTTLVPGENLPPRGAIVGVISARGGLGASTLALNVALVLQQKSNAGIAAVELHPGQGRWGFELAIDRLDGLNNLLRMEPDAITADAVKNEITYHRSGVHLLLASHLIKDLPLMGAIPQMEKIIQQLAYTQDMTLLDIGADLFPGIEKVLDKCSQLIVVVDPNPVSVAHTKSLLQDLSPQEFGRAKPITLVLLNRQRTDLQVSRNQIQDDLGLPVEMVISPAPELAYQAVLRHTPLAQMQPEGLTTLQFGLIANHLMKFLPQPVA